MNGVDNMLYMQSTNANDGTMTLQGHLRRRDRHQHRPGQRAEPGVPGPAEPAAGRQPVRPDRQEVRRHSAAGRLALLAEGHLRRALPRQLRDHQRQRRALPRPGRRTDPELRRRRLRDAHLGQARPPREPRPDGAGPHQRGAAAEHRQPVGRHRRRAGADGPGVHLHGALAGAARHGRGVRQRRRAAEPGRLGGAPEGRRRIELGALNYQQRARLNGKPACPIGVFQAPGLQRARGRRGRQEGDGGAEAARSRTTSTTWSRSTRRCRSPRASRRSSTRSSRRWCSSSSSSSSSCRTGARR